MHKRVLWDVINVGGKIVVHPLLIVMQSARPGSMFAQGYKAHLGVLVVINGVTLTVLMSVACTSGKFEELLLGM